MHLVIILWNFCKKTMGCPKLSILDEQYKRTEIKVSCNNLTSDFCVENAGSYRLFGQIISEYRSDWMLDTIPRFLFNAKEKDSESGLLYYGARYYSDVDLTYRSRDNCFEKVPFFSPYAQCFNNPVKLIDPDGNFPMGMHADMVRTAFSAGASPTSTQTLARYNMVEKIATGASTRADIRFFNKPTVHMDGMKGTASIAKRYNMVKDIFNLQMNSKYHEEAGTSLHTISDFYSHSNYIPLYSEYASNNGLSMDINDIPTFSEAQKNPALMKFIKEKGGLKTGTFKNIIYDRNTNDPDAHGNMNLDDNGPQCFGSFPYDMENMRGPTLHDAARATAQKELNTLAEPYK